jgi:competence protein ComEC
MIDVNNSQDFDLETYNEELFEERTRLLKAQPSYGLGGLLSSNPFGNPSSAFSGGQGLGALNLLGSRNAFTEYAIDEAAKEAVKARAALELTDPIAFLKRNYPGQQIWRFVLTHPDLDHMRGLKNLYEHIGIANFWDTNHTKQIPNFRGDPDKEDWDFYQTLRAGSLSANARKYVRGDSYFAFGKEEDGRLGGDNIEILSPTPELVGACNTADKSNDLSLVLRLHHAGQTVLLPGDAEELAWDGMCEHYGARLKSNFLKASHHGRDSGYNLRALQLIAPVAAFVSVGRKPDTDASAKYRYHTTVRSTRYYGDIELRIEDNGSFRTLVDRNAGNP